MTDGSQFEPYKVSPNIEVSDQQVIKKDLEPKLSPQDAALKMFLDEVELLSTQLWRKTIVWEKPTRTTHHNHPTKDSFLD